MAKVFLSASEYKGEIVMEEKKWCVYIHTSPSNKAYIGITGRKPEERWGKNGYHYKNNKYFWRAIQKHGWCNFKHEIFADNLTKEQACFIEIKLIALFETQNPKYGYNIASGGEANSFKLSEETKKKISQDRIGMYQGEKNPMYGISPKERMDEETYIKWEKQQVDLFKSDEFRQKNRERNLGKKYSDEINKKKGRKGELHHNYGKHLSDEQKEALRKANLGKKQSEETIQKKREIMTGDVLENMKKNQPNRIEIMCIETGQIFISMAEASRQLNIDMSSIRRSLNGEYKYKTPKYNFIRVDKEET